MWRKIVESELDYVKIRLDFVFPRRSDPDPGKIHPDPQPCFSDRALGWSWRGAQLQIHLHISPVSLIEYFTKKKIPNI